MKRVTSGEWSPGTLIPSEATLAREFGISVGTLRKAFDSLEHDNVIIRQQGRGTVVATHNEDRALFRFFNLGDLNGERVFPVSRVIECSTRRSTADERSALDLKPSARVIDILRVRDLKGSAAVVEHVILDAHRFAGLEQEPGKLPNTLYRLYQQRYGVTVASADERVTAVAADARESKLLAIPKGTPLLKVRRIATDLTHRPVELRISAILTAEFCYFNRL